MCQSLAEVADEANFLLKKQALVSALIVLLDMFAWEQQTHARLLSERLKTATNARQDSIVP